MLVALATDATGDPEVVVLPAPGSEAWQPLEFAAVDRHTRYSRAADDSLVAASDCAASGLVLPLRNTDLSDTPLLRWRWRIDEPLDIHDERSKPGDDFAARVYVLFRFDSVHASVFERLRHLARSTVYGDLPGKTLNFVWTSHEPPGEAWDNPFARDAKMIALARGGPSEWRNETVDVAEYYRRYLAPPSEVQHEVRGDVMAEVMAEVMGLAVMTDSDNSCQTARARYADFSFASRPDVHAEPKDDHAD